MKILQSEGNNEGLRRILLVATIVAIISQFNISLFISDFNISIAIILFPLFLYVFDELNIVRTAILTALFVCLLKIGVHMINGGEFITAMTENFPEMFFYICYGFFFKVYKDYDPSLKLKYLFFSFLIIDYLANLIELTIRLNGDIFVLRVQMGLVVVAVVRSLLVWLSLYAIEYYNVFLLRKEHESRYKKLLCLTSRLKCEMFWMEKNMYHIESTMTEAYNLFENIKNSEECAILANSALNIAKEIHEVKKEYSLVVRGLKEAVDSNLRDNGMYIKELIKILKSTMEGEAIANKKLVKISFSVEKDFFTSSHYYLMSIFRNLIVNAIEAMRDSPDNVGEEKYVKFTHSCKNQCHEFRISDNGSGIKDRYINNIFSPGFSTKINYSTGEINRGLGLSLVKDIINDVLHGEVEFISKENIGTEFIIKIPREELEDVK
ncbi:MAG: ATP-binding protein [Clostridium sp.]